MMFAAVCLPLQGFKTSHSISLFFSWCGGQASLWFAISSISMAAEIMFPLSPEVLHTGLVSFSAKMASPLLASFYKAT